MIKLVLSNGMFHEFEEDDALNLNNALEWFRTADCNGVITLSARNGTWHVQKRHIVHIEVSR